MKDKLDIIEKEIVEAILPEVDLSTSESVEYILKLIRELKEEI